jgi:predicted ATPase
LQGDNTMTETRNDPPLALSEIHVEGFKSLRDRVSVDLRRLTVLAGANSSGKSSLIQPVLLLKQTYDPAYDPGPLWLGGPNVVFSDVEQIFWAMSEQQKKTFTVAMASPSWGVEITFAANGGAAETHPIRIVRCVWGDARKDIENACLTPGMSESEIHRALSSHEDEAEVARLSKAIRYRATLIPVNKDEERRLSGPWNDLPLLLRHIIHVPGLRGNPERTYKRISSDAFTGLFQEYAASIIFRWQQEPQTDALAALERELYGLGLTGKVEARAVSATDLELRVGRLRDRGSQDMVSIADVGFGVSQVLPVIVALLVVKPGQIVYLEQPEIHLHPRAQVSLAETIARAVNRGVQVIVETHSELLLLGIQRLVAVGELAPDKVKLHWFTRDDEGVTRVTPAVLDEEGSFGDWPVDFADVSMQAMRAYLDAVTLRR